MKDAECESTNRREHLERENSEYADVYEEISEILKQEELEDKNWDELYESKVKFVKKLLEYKYLGMSARMKPGDIDEFLDWLVYKCPPECKK